MKKTLKTTLASTIIVGALALPNLIEGSTVEAAQPDSYEVNKSWYEYQGDAGYDARFVLKEDFIEAVKNNNVKMNGVLLQLDPSKIHLGNNPKIETFTIHDQVFYKVKNEEHPYMVEFDTKNNLLTKEAVKEAYKDYSIEEGTNSMQITVNKSQVIFEYKDGIITTVKF